eukprot:11207746-Lingulodinium_polyedra.AAC.1
MTETLGDCKTDRRTDWKIKRLNARKTTKLQNCETVRLQKLREHNTDICKSGRPRDWTDGTSEEMRE